MANKDLKEIQQSSVGITLTMQTGIPLDDTTDMKLILKVGEEKQVIDLTEANISNSATGEVTYVTEEGDLDTTGTYSAQLIDVTAGIFLPSKIFKFKVVANIE